MRRIVRLHASARAEEKMRRICCLWHVDHQRCSIFDGAAPRRSSRNVSDRFWAVPASLLGELERELANDCAADAGGGPARQRSSICPDKPAL